MFTAQLGDFLRETQTGEAGRESRTEPCLGDPLLLDRVAENLADFLFRAVTMTACASLKLELHVVVEVPNE
ncbi:MAG: hypothetical protein WAM82_10330 [Thermoanaerobaculia bacterium]